jgi:beta-glucosidase
MSKEPMIRFPDGFRWGVAASAYQIEGGYDEDGRGLSIWDTFCRQPGKIERGETGDIAADHYHRWREDVQIMADLGLQIYRFSIAWPRILPEGTGQVNPPGLDFYDHLVDALLEKGITPLPTLYHWDLPQALQDKGGWGNRDTAHYFAEYARIVGERLSDRVQNWITHNEPFVAAVAGHFTGEHAPGLQDPFLAFRAGHHLLLSHGYAVEALRATAKQTLQIGIALNLSPVHPASESEADQQAARRYDGVLSRLFLDPILRAKYPEDIVELLGPVMPQVEPDDMRHIAVPLDFVGVNYYSRTVIRYDPDFPLIQASEIKPEGREYSQMWEIYPPGIYELLTRIWNDYRPASIFVTENGVCVPDGVDFDGRVRDYRRIRYLRDHLVQVHRAIAEGVPVRGYLVWSLLDNFEWAFGYRMRFGLTYVDFETQKRIIKESGHWFAQVIRENGFNPDVVI